MAREKNRFAGIFIGPIVIVIGISVLWSNEGRFDYAAAARGTQVMPAPNAEFDDQLISYTGSMEIDLTMRAKYVESFVGYLTVTRSAEIYAWERDEDDDGRVTWSKQWMSTVESNTRNSRDNVHQKLSSEVFRPDNYNVGKLTINEKSIEFVDNDESIPTANLTLTTLSKNTGLQKQGEYLYLKKSKSNQIGDERLSYEGIPVPRTATYFGEYRDGRGIAHQMEQKGGFIENLIGDTGVLHFIVAGDRSVALSTMQSHLTRIKWLFRGGGFLGISVGFMITFSAVAGFLYHIPILGPIVQYGALFGSLILGATLSILTITISFLFHNPMILILILIALCVGVWLIRYRGKKSQTQFKQALDLDLGHVLSDAELAELEFIELVRLCFSDKEVHIDERKYLTKWAKKQGWNKEKIAELVEKAKKSDDGLSGGESTDKHMRHLIRLALADGEISRFELNTISQVADEVGYSRSELQQIIQQMRSSLAT